MCTGNNPNGKPATELVARVHQVCRSDLGGAMQCCPMGAEESVYFLRETSSHQLAILIKLLQYPHELLGLPVSLWVQGCLPLMRKTQICDLLKSLKSFLLNEGLLSLLTDADMLSEAKVLFRLGITALALVEVTNSTPAHLDCLQTVTTRYSPV